MKNQDLKNQIEKNNKEHLLKVLNVLKEDPNASEDLKNYSDTESYLTELIEKKGSLLEGIIIALETYLEK